MLQGLLKRCDEIAAGMEILRDSFRRAERNASENTEDLACAVAVLAASQRDLANIVGELVNRELGTPVNPQTGKPL